MIVISDTTPIISLLKAGRLELLGKLYQKVVIPEAVFDRALQAHMTGTRKKFAKRRILWH